MKPNNVSFLKLLFGSLYTDKQFRRIGVFNFSGVALVFVGSQLGSIFNNFNFTSPFLYVTLLGLVVMLVTFALLMFRTGVYKPIALRKALRDKKSDQYNIYKYVDEGWDGNSANNFYKLINNGLEPAVALRWSTITSIEGIDHDAILDYVPTLIQRDVSPILFQEVYESGITDIPLAANFAEYGIDPSVAKAMIESSSSF